MLGTGSQREWLEPLDSEGNRHGHDLLVEGRMVGCHLGNFAGLNVCDPQPGFEYEWMMNPSRSGGSPADGMKILQVGGQVVTDEDPEFAAFKHMEGMGGSSPMDTSTVYKELVLVRIPVERQRARLEAIKEKNEKMLRRGPAETFVGGASALEQSQRYNERGPTRFAMNDHRTEFNHGRDIAEVSLPDSGIVRTEHIE
jgi:hypothetical protein